MTTLMVLYGHPRNAKAFDQHYAARHLPLVERLPGLKAITLSQPGISPPLLTVVRRSSHSTKSS
jgi:uncharacterized protein (TIGR02118 family)